MKKIIYLVLITLWSALAYSQTVTIPSGSTARATQAYTKNDSVYFQLGSYGSVRVPVYQDVQYKTVQTLVQRNAIPSAFRKKGMLVWVADSVKHYVLTTGITNSDWVALTTDLSAYELLSNKQTDLTASATKYPTVNAVNTGLATKQNTLAYTPENVANKQTDLTASSTSYPTVNAVNTGLATKEPSITAGTTGQYYRGDKTFQTLNKAAVGLGNVDNTSDAAKPISTATQTALDAISSSVTTDFLGDYPDIASLPIPVNNNLHFANVGGDYGNPELYAWQYYDDVGTATYAWLPVGKNLANSNLTATSSHTTNIGDNALGIQGTHAYMGLNGASGILELYGGPLILHSAATIQVQYDNFKLYGDASGPGIANIGDISNLTEERSYSWPDTSGTIPLTVAGIPADASGNIPVPLNYLGLYNLDELPTPPIDDNLNLVAVHGDGPEFIPKLYIYCFNEVLEDYAWTPINTVITSSKTASGDGSSTTISIPHLFGGTPDFYSAIATNAAAAGISYVTIDATNINIHYSVAPANGTNNLSYNLTFK